MPVLAPAGPAPRYAVHSARPPRRITTNLLLLIAAVTAAKLWCAARWGWTTDIRLTEEGVRVFLDGARSFNLFWPSVEHARFPLGYYACSVGAWWMAQATGTPFAFWIKAPAVVADGLIAWLLVGAGGRRLALCYLFNPVSFLLSVYHGQLHTVATAGVVWALACAQRGAFGPSGAALALGASVRHHFAALIAPLLAQAKGHRSAVLAGFAAVAAATNVSLIGGYGDRLVAPVSAYGAWGYGMLLAQGPRLLARFGLGSVTAWTDPINQALSHAAPLLSWMWLAFFCVWVWRRAGDRAHPLDVWRASLLYIIGQYVISPGFGVQWLIWALPLWLVVDRRSAFLYSALAGAFLAGSYWQWQLNGIYQVASITANLGILRTGDVLGVLAVGIMGVATWLYCAVWAWRLARS